MKPGGKIGFFDSGLGGLNVMRAVAAQLPQYNYVYLGDTANKPYANKPASEVRGHVQQGVSFLFDQGCELVIVACNTATAQSLKFIQQQFVAKFAPHRHVLGVIVPAAEAAVMATRTNRIGVIGTQGAMETGVFAEEIQKLRPEAAVYQQAVPELVPMIESGLHHGQEMGMVLRHYLQSVLAAGVDTLVLGCTHYEQVAPQIAEIAGPGVALINPAPVVAERTQDYLFRHADLSHKLVQGGERKFFFTSNAGVFAGLGKEFYGQPFTAEEAKI